MADSRIKDLTGTTVTQALQALLDTLYLAVDDASYVNAKKILLKSLLYDSIVSGNSNNYQGMTPKAFYDSVMTSTRLGIGRQATSTEITDKDGDGLILSSHQSIMQTQWKKDLFSKNGYAPDSFITDTGDITTANSIAYQVVFNGYLTTTSPGAHIYLHPAALQAVGKSFSAVYFSYISEKGGNVTYGTHKISASPSYIVSFSIGDYTVYLNRYAKTFYFSNMIPAALAKVSVTINAIIGA